LIANPKSKTAAEALIKALGGTESARIVVEGFYQLARFDGMAQILRLEENRAKVNAERKKAA
jgi:hypothetical protein